MEQQSTLAGEDESAAHVSAIGRKAGRGLRWALSGSVLVKLGSFAMGLVLVRLLVPEDFGLYAVALAATGFIIHINDMGIIAATAQWRGRVEEMAPTAATIALGFSIVCFALFWVAAPGFSQLAGSPEATPIVRLLTVTIVIDGITAVRVGAIQRGFQQDKLTTAILAGFLANAPTAIILAANGAGAYSFVIGQLAQSAVTGVMVLRIARLPFRYGFDRVLAKRLLKFGAPLAAGLAVESVLVFSGSVIVGHMLGPALLGFYLLAFNVSSWVPGLVGTAVRYVSIPGFSRLAEQESDALALGVRRAIPMMVTFVIPIAVTMAVLAPPMVNFLFGARWLPAGEALRFLAVGMVARMLTALAFDILISLGKTTATVLLNVGWAAALIPSLIAGVHLDGIRGAAIAQAIVAVVIAIPLTAIVLQYNGVDLRPLAPAMIRPLIGGLFAGLLMFGLSALLKLPSTAELFVAGGAGLIAYLVVAIPPRQFRQLIASARHRHGEAQA